MESWKPCASPAPERAPLPPAVDQTCRPRPKPLTEVLPPRGSPEPNPDARQTLRTLRFGRHARAKPCKALYIWQLHLALEQRQQPYMTRATPNATRHVRSAPTWPTTTPPDGQKRVRREPLILHWFYKALRQICYYSIGFVIFCTGAVSARCCHREAQRSPTQTRAKRYAH